MRLSHACLLSISLHAACIAGVFVSGSRSRVEARWNGAAAPAGELSIRTWQARPPEPQTAAVLPVPVEPTPPEGPPPDASVPEALASETPRTIDDVAYAVPAPVPPPPRPEWLKRVVRERPPVAVAAEAAAPARPGAGFVQPSPVAGANPPPQYPAAARRRGIEGTVTVLLEIDAEGAVTGARVEHSSGHRELDEAALRKLATWRFTPARRLGLAVSSSYRQQVVFRLSRALAAR